MSKIAGVLIAYYPDFNKLIFNIDTFIDHIEELFIFFNSPANQIEINTLQKKYSKVHLILSDTNVGIASALNQTAQKALDLGYKWLLTMDQDSFFQTGLFFKAFENRITDNIAVYCPTPSRSIEVSPESAFYTEEILCAITSGNLLNLEIWSAIGGFEEKLFIDEVDNDYCLKAVLSGFKIIRFKNIALIHELGKNKETSFLFKKYSIITHAPIRAYYIFRNNLYIFSKYKKSFPEFVRSRKLILLKVFIKIVLFSDYRFQNCRYIVAGIKDYLNNSYGSYNCKSQKLTSI
jgi:rhamnosyltransferase